MIDPILFILALAGGIVSFLTPCNASTLPVFISYIQGQAKSTKRAILLSLAFSLGFISMFTIIASLFILVSGFIKYMFWLKLIAGIIIICMAFYLYFSKNSLDEPSGASDNPPMNPNDMSYTIKNTESNHDKDEQKGLMNAAVLGFSMGSPWIACITPIYLTIVSVAMVQESFMLGMLLFSIYGLGLMIPYILIGATLGKINQRFIVKLIKVGSRLQKIFALILIWLGIEFILSAFGFTGLLPYI